MGNKVNVCGVDFHRGDGNFNGYCECEARRPMFFTDEQELQRLREKARRALQSAAEACHELAEKTPFGYERDRAFQTHTNVVRAWRDT